jgi:hypothetical protein
MASNIANIGSGHQIERGTATAPSKTDNSISFSLSAYPSEIIIYLGEPASVTGTSVDYGIVTQIYWNGSILYYTSVYGDGGSSNEGYKLRFVCGRSNAGEYTTTMFTYSIIDLAFKLTMLNDDLLYTRSNGYKWIAII